MEWVRPGASPFEPFTGDWFASRGPTTSAYKRLSRRLTLPAGPSTFSFRTSYDLERDYDYGFVEIHTVGQDDWTTLAEKNGLTSTDTGQSCPSTGPASNWQSLHPFLAHYQTKNPDGVSCKPTGTSGEWNAATGNSAGGRRWEIDIPADYRARRSSCRSRSRRPGDARTRFLVDDTKLVAGRTEVFDTSFEDGLGGWSVGAVPAGTALPGPELDAGPGRAVHRGRGHHDPRHGLHRVRPGEDPGHGKPGDHVLREALATSGRPRSPSPRAGARRRLRRRDAAAGPGRRRPGRAQRRRRPGARGCSLGQGDPRLARGPGGDPPDLPEDGEGPLPHDGAADVGQAGSSAARRSRRGRARRGSRSSWPPPRGGC